MKFKNIHIYLLIALTILLGVNFYLMSQKEDLIILIPRVENNPIQNEEPVKEPNVIEISTQCAVNSDCSWQVTNCCSENAGANWQCIGRESTIACNELVICPQIVSPKPEKPCSCIQGSCVSG